MSKETNKIVEPSEAVKKATQIVTDKEARTCTFTKTYKVRGRNKTGTFTFKYPSLVDRMQIGVARAKLLDGATEQSLDRITSDLVYMVSYIGKLCTKQPNWFNLNTLEEYDVIQDLFKEVSEWVMSFRRDLEASEDSGYSDSANDEDDLDSNEAV